MQLDREIREGVIASLPEAEEIKNSELRDRVYDAWTLALQENGYRRIEEMENSATPGRMVIEKGNQTDHLRGVARLAMVIGREMKETFGELEFDMDEVIAGALCHDLGKPFEYNSDNRKRWSSDPSKTGFPSIRHTQYGTYVGLTVGLPESVVHIAGSHSMEGQSLQRSLTCEIVRYADEAHWGILIAGGMVKV
jgi:putative nucleotidyltransferase with HDIG domain